MSDSQKNLPQVNGAPGPAADALAELEQLITERCEPDEAERALAQLDALEESVSRAWAFAYQMKVERDGAIDDFAELETAVKHHDEVEHPLVDELAASIEARLLAEYGGEALTNLFTDSLGWDPEIATDIADALNNIGEALVGESDDYIPGFNRLVAGLTGGQ